MQRISVFLLLLCCSCSTLFGEPPKTPVLQATVDEAETATIEILERKGFMLDADRSKPGRIRTQWQVRLSPHWRQGYRERVSVDILAQEDGCVASVQVYHEINDAASSPLSMDDAIWIKDGNNEELQEELIFRLRMKHGGPQAYP